MRSHPLVVSLSHSKGGEPIVSYLQNLSVISEVVTLVHHWYDQRSTFFFETSILSMGIRKFYLSWGIVLVGFVRKPVEVMHPYQRTLDISFYYSILSEPFALYCKGGIPAKGDLCI
jgi:hypothetical protein